MQGSKIEKKIQFETVLFSNIFSHTKIRCEKQNAPCINSILDPEKKIYLVNGCRHLVCEKCFNEVKSQCEKKKLNPGNKMVCQPCNDFNEYTLIEFPENWSPEDKKLYKVSEQEYLNLYQKYLISLNAFNKESKKYDACFFHKDQAPSFIYYSFHENNDQDTFICTECYSKYNKVDQGFIKPIEEALIEFENLMDRFQNNLENEISNLKKKMQLVQSVMDDLDKTSQVQEMEVEKVFSQLETSILKYYENEIISLNEEHGMREKNINDRIERLDLFKEKLNDHLSNFDSKFVDLVTDADYTVDNIQNLMSSSNFLKENSIKLNELTKNEKADEVAYEKIESSSDLNKLKNTLRKAYSIKSEEKNINPIVPLY
jgi:hypothetical protein